jgi:hypothetical protein
MPVVPRRPPLRKTTDSQDAQLGLYCNHLVHFPHEAAQLPLMTCCLSTNLRFSLDSLQVSMFTFTLLFEHHLLFGRQIFIILRAGKYSADHTTI